MFYFEFETVLKFYNLDARLCTNHPAQLHRKVRVLKFGMFKVEMIYIQESKKRD